MRTKRRPVIYREQEAMIMEKKNHKLQLLLQQEQDHGQSTRTYATRKRRKTDTFEVKQDKRKAKFMRKAENIEEEHDATTSDQSQVEGQDDEYHEELHTAIEEHEEAVADEDAETETETEEEGDRCKSCKQRGHKSARGKACPNYNPTIKDTLKEMFPQGYNRCVISTPVANLVNEGMIEHVNTVSLFQREVIYKTQLFVNYYIMTASSSGIQIPNSFFEQNFFYSLCRLTMMRVSSEDVSKANKKIIDLDKIYKEYITKFPECIVPTKPPNGYSQSLSDACLTLETTYTNFYVETFESRIINFLIACLSNRFPDIKKGIVKGIAEEYAIYTITKTMVPQETKLPEDDRNTIKEFIDTDQDIANARALIPVTPLTKANLTKFPRGIIPLFKYMLRVSESLVDRYHSERLQQVIDSVRSILKAATSLRRGLNLVSSHIEGTKVSLKTLLDAMEDGEEGKLDDLTLFFSKDFLKQSNMYIEATIVTVKLVDSVLKGIVSLQKDIKFSFSNSKDTFQAADTLKDFVDETKRRIDTLQRNSMQVKEIAEISQTVIENDVSTVAQRIQAVNDISNAFDWSVVIPSSISETIASNLDQVLGLAQTDLDHYVATFPIILPPSADNSTTGHVADSAESSSTAQPVDRTTNVSTIPVTNIPRLLSLFPCPGYSWRFVKIDGANVNAFSKIGYSGAGKTLKSNSEAFLRVVQFTNIHQMEKIRTIEDLMALPETKDMLFLNEMKTDGYTCRLSFAKRNISTTTNERKAANLLLSLEDFEEAEINRYFKPVTVDPGRTHAIVSYHGSEQKRRFSTKEYYHYGGAGSRAKKMNKRKKNILPGINLSIEEIETNIPTAKSSDLNQYIRHVRYILTYLSNLFEFYNFESSAKDKWENFVSRKSALEEAANILIHGGKKYYKNKRRKNGNKRKRRESRKKKKRFSNQQEQQPEQQQQSYQKNMKRRSNFEVGEKNKMPLVVFGAGMFGKDGVRIKKKQYGIVDKIFKKLQEKEALGELCLLTIDEYYTSQVCNKCKTRSLSNVVDSSGKKLHATLECKNCETLIWNRDIMAAKNMWDISWSIWRGQGRPEEFKPEERAPSQQPQQEQQ